MIFLQLFLEVLQSAHSMVLRYSLISLAPCRWFWRLFPSVTDSGCICIRVSCPIGSILQLIPNYGKMDFLRSELEGKYASSSPWPKMSAGRFGVRFCWITLRNTALLACAVLYSSSFLDSGCSCP